MRTMITFRSGALKRGRSRRGVVLPPESSHETVNKLNQPGLSAVAIKPPPGQAVDFSPAPPESPAAEKIERFYSDDWKTERWKFFLSSLPLSLVIGLGFYLFLTGTPQWLVSTVLLIGFFVFGFAGFLIEQRGLKAFACPRCEAPIEDWDTNETHRVLFHCAHCGSCWDIEFKPYPEPELRPSPA